MISSIKMQKAKNEKFLTGSLSPFGYLLCHLKHYAGLERPL